MELVTDQRKQLLMLRAEAKALEIVAARREETGNPLIGAALVHHILSKDEQRLRADCSLCRMREAMESR